MNDYTSMTHEELIEHKQQIDEALTVKEVEALEARVAALGYKLVKENGKGNGKRGPVKPKYQNPDNPEDQWSGRGKPPKWMQAHIEAGNTKDDYLIQ